MSVKKIDLLFPHAEFTGRSEVHRSKAWAFELGSNQKKHFLSLGPEKTAEHLVKIGVGGIVIHRLLTTFGGVHWFFDKEDLSHLVDMLVRYHAKNGNLELKNDRVLNPCTGSVFIPVGKKENVLLSLRCWVDVPPLNAPRSLALEIGWRARLTLLKEQNKDEEVSREVFTRLKESGLQGLLKNTQGEKILEPQKSTEFDHLFEVN